jgi:RNA polymerase sigma-70 factor (ECF subfamily)
MTSVELHPQALAAAGGDDVALAQLVQAYHERVYRFGLRVCESSADAEDAVQEAFLKLARRPDVMASSGALYWLFRVVRTLCLLPFRPFVRLWKQRKVSIDAAAQAELRSATLDPEEALARWELVQAVHAAIAQLERPYREVLVMRDIEGLSGEDTARALGLELTAMKTRLHRARTQLRGALKAHAQQRLAKEVR